MRALLGAVAGCVLACQQPAAVAPAKPDASALDCSAERQRLSAELSQAWPCRLKDDCRLLRVEGLGCDEPVGAGAFEQLRQRGGEWRRRCKPPHADCFGGGEPACVEGRCAWAPSPKSAY